MTRLKKILLTGVGTMALLFGIQKDHYNPIEKETPLPKPDTSFLLNDFIIFQDQLQGLQNILSNLIKKTPHQPYGTIDPTYPFETDIKGSQFRGHILKPFYLDINGNVKFETRHCHAATDINENTAQTIAQQTFNEIACFSSTISDNPFTDEQSKTIKDSTTITLSYIPAPYRDGHDWRLILQGKSILQDDKKRQSLKDFWQNTDTISIQSAGNSVVYSPKQRDRQNEFNVAYNDTHLRIGAAYYHNGKYYVDFYSTPSAPTAIAVNPFENGFEYNYHYNQQNIIDEANRRFQLPDDLKRLNGCDLPKNKDDITYVNFRSLKQKAINCIVKKWKRSDVQNQSDPILGTSFTAPHASGMILGAKAIIEKQFGTGILSSFDYFVATILAADPVQKVRFADYRKSPKNLRYRNNGIGLHYNDNFSGFGIIQHQKLLNITKTMASQIKKNPSLKTKPIYLSSTMEKDTVSRQNDYHFNISDDQTLLRTMLALEFEGGTDNSPKTIEIISPDGVSMTLSPSKEMHGNSYSFATTNGFAGNSTKGTWTIRLPKDVKLKNATLDMVAVQKNGVIDHAIEKKVQETKGKRYYANGRTYKPLQF